MSAPTVSSYFVEDQLILTVELCLTFFVQDPVCTWESSPVIYMHVSQILPVDASSMTVCSCIHDPVAFDQLSYFLCFPCLCVYFRSFRNFEGSEFLQDLEKGLGGGGGGGGVGAGGGGD